MSADSTPGPSRRFHYVLTECLPYPQGVQYATSSGSLNLGPAVTRTEAFQYLRDQLRDHNGWPEHGDVLFFSLEPDDLTAS